MAAPNAAKATKLPLGAPAEGSPSEGPGISDPWNGGRPAVGHSLGKHTPRQKGMPAPDMQSSQRPVVSAPAASRNPEQTAQQPALELVDHACLPAGAKATHGDPLFEAANPSLVSPRSPRLLDSDGHATHAREYQLAPSRDAKVGDEWRDRSCDVADFTPEHTARVASPYTLREEDAEFAAEQPPGGMAWWRGGSTSTHPAAATGAGEGLVDADFEAGSTLLHRLVATAVAAAAVAAVASSVGADADVLPLSWMDRVPQPPSKAYGTFSDTAVPAEACRGAGATAPAALGSMLGAPAIETPSDEWQPFGPDACKTKND